jgi:hypothetical protein
VTTPVERTWAVQNTERFLMDLLDPKKTPRIPKAIRRRAASMLRHFPSKYYRDKPQELAPEVWGEPRD